MELKMLASLLTIPSLVIADVPNTFQAGEAIKASEMNENFTSIDNEVSAVAEDTTGHATSISDLESEVAMLKGQLESLQSSSGSPVVFQGFSVGLVDGSMGYLGLQAACDATFTGSKICSSREIVNSIHNPNAANLSGEAFAMPSLIGGPNEYGGSHVDGLGYVDPFYSNSQKFSCSGFTTNAPQASAFTVSSTGSLRVFTSRCQVPRPVACCK